MWTIISTPAGPLRIVARAGALTAADFVDPSLATSDNGSGDPRLAAVPQSPGPSEERRDDDPLLQNAAIQFRAYFAADLKEFDLPLAPAGTVFQQRVWCELRRIGYGEVTTYGAVATRLGMTGHAARAVGAANGANPIAIAIPCHRVVGANRTLTGYAGGLARKQQLLALEGVLL